MEAKILYWEQNGETMIVKENPNVLRDILRKGSVCATWEESHTPYGYYRCELYATPLGLFVKKEWVPAPGYSASEILIYRLHIP